MIPYVSFWCIMQFTHSVLAGFTRSGGYDIADEIVALFTGGHYWFLYDLLLVMITTRLFRSFKGGLILLATIAVICRLSISDMPTNMWRYFLYTPFFIAGIYMRRNYSVIRKFVSEYRLPILLFHWWALFWLICLKKRNVYRSYGRCCVVCNYVLYNTL